MDFAQAVQVLGEFAWRAELNGHDSDVRIQAMHAVRQWARAQQAEREAIAEAETGNDAP